MSATPEAIERVTISVDPLMRLSKAADLCGVSSQTLRRMARMGDIRSVKVGSEIRIPAWAVEAFSKGEPCK